MSCNPAFRLRVDERHQRNAVRATQCLVREVLQHGLGPEISTHSRGWSGTVKTPTATKIASCAPSAEAGWRYDLCDEKFDKYIFKGCAPGVDLKGEGLSDSGGV